MNDIKLERGNFFAAPTYFRADPETGIMSTRSGRRVVNLDIDFLQGFRDAFEIECGEASDDVMETCGQEYGQLFSRQLDADLSDFYDHNARRIPVAMFDALLEQALSHYGWGKLSLHYENIDRGILSAEVHNPIYGSIVAKSHQPVDSLLAGFLGGVFTYFSEEPLHCVQTDCVLLGHSSARFVISAPDRIDEVRELAREGAGHDAVVEALSATTVS